MWKRFYTVKLVINDPNYLNKIDLNNLLNCLTESIRNYEDYDDKVKEDINYFSS